MTVPSIEATLSRKTVADHPIAKRLDALPGVGALARAWVRATHTAAPRALWASLPPVAAA